MKTLFIFTFIFLFAGCINKDHPHALNKTEIGLSDVNVLNGVSTNLKQILNNKDAIAMQMFEMGYFLALKNVQEENIHVFNNKEIFQQFSIDSLWAQKMLNKKH